MIARYHDAEELEYMTIRKLLLGCWFGRQAVGNVLRQIYKWHSFFNDETLCRLALLIYKKKEIKIYRLP
jgi:hypothetical protein